jgi:hypothetical protein
MENKIKKCEEVKIMAAVVDRVEERTGKSSGGENVGFYILATYTYLHSNFVTTLPHYAIIS